MAISPDELRNKTFTVSPRGYDRPEVNRYLGAIADELNQFNNSSNSKDQAEPTAPSLPSVAASNLTDTPAQATPQTDQSSTTDHFDRVGTEISLMLRQAQDSATKIRSDAELEAGTLVEQVRLDIEADRIAHEQAARELIARTEERAMAIRLTAEQDSQELREAADEYSTTRKDVVDAEFAEAEAAAVATRHATAESIAAASRDADAILNNARTNAQEIVAEAEVEGRARRDQLVSQARLVLQDLVAAETRTREELDQTRRNIESALAQLKISELDQEE